MQNTEKQMCEMATGCVQKGQLVYYKEGGEKLTPKQAMKLFFDRESVEAPAAGAGSYQEVFNDLGFYDVKIIDWTSSAGDWCFGIRTASGWYAAYQENRYPYFGFKYGIITDILPCETFEELCREINFM